MGSGHVFRQFVDFSFHSSSTFSLSLASVLAILACDQQVAVVNGSTALIWEFNGNIVGFPGGSAEKNPYGSAGDGGKAGRTGVGFQSLGQKDPPGGGNGDLLQYSCLENRTDRGAWQATVRGISKSQDTTKHAHTIRNTRFHSGPCALHFLWFLPPHRASSRRDRQP